VKSVRIGMDGKTPPTTSVVVDLDQALAYDLTPGPADHFVLTLHTQAAAKNSPAVAPAKPSAPVVNAQAAPAKPAVAPPSGKMVAGKAAEVKPTAPAAKATVAVTPIASSAKGSVVVKPGAPAAKTAVVVTPAASAGKTSAVVAPLATATPSKPAVEALKVPEAPKPAEHKWAMTGKRDPFFSPVVQSNGSGCSTGKKCLEIGQINLRGVVKSENGFIAVVTNSLNKAYFLRENDPVFNGYVVKITGDSVVFQETVQDKLGKTFTREVVKKIFTPAV
jgi:Tfp pilus assembly protein PilP